MGTMMISKGFRPDLLTQDQQLPGYPRWTTQNIQAVVERPARFEPMEDIPCGHVFERLEVMLGEPGTNGVADPITVERVWVMTWLRYSGRPFLQPIRLQYQDWDEDYHDVALHASHQDTEWEEFLRKRCGEPDGEPKWWREHREKLENKITAFVGLKLASWETQEAA